MLGKKIKLDIGLINEKISEIIYKNKLDRMQNDFFQAAKKCENVTQNVAFMIAYNWYFITKTFMFTSIKGLGNFADIVLSQQGSPDADMLYVLQTAFAVISDDLNNVHPTFKKAAPKGPPGIHYKWWEDSILTKLEALANVKPVLFEGTQFLLKKMKSYSLKHMGLAVQLRVVETIAENVAKALLQICNKAEHRGEKVFPHKEDKLWISTHIQAETIHHRQVSNEISGMAKIASTLSEQEAMLLMVDEYCKAWAKALTGLAQCIVLS